MSTIADPETVDIAMETVDCPLGCPPDDEILFTGRERLHNLPGRFTVVRCRTCGLMRTNPRPTPESIGLYYPSDYGPYSSTQVSGSVRRMHPRPWYKKWFRAVFQFNTDRLPKLMPGRMLEFGCASGAFMNRVAAEGWECEGIEYSPEASEAARRLGFKVHTGPLETAPEPEQPYDLIVGWMVLEHLHDPAQALRKLQSWTKPGGWLVVSIPNAASKEFQLFKDAWYAVDLPRHLYHFTPKTLSKLFDQTGWKMERVLYQRILSDSIASFGNRLLERGWSPGVTRPLREFPEKSGYKNYALLPLATVMGAFGQVGRMTVWARKPEG